MYFKKQLTSERVGQTTGVM